MYLSLMSYELSQKYRLVARTTPEIYYGLNELVTRFAARDDIQFRGRKLGVEAAVNAIALHWLSLDGAEQLRIIREGVVKFEMMLEGGDAGGQDVQQAGGQGPAQKKGGPKAAGGKHGETTRPGGFEIDPGAEAPPLRPPGKKLPRKRGNSA